MVDKSCHNHGGLLLYVALKREEKCLHFEIILLLLWKSHPAPLLFEMKR